MKREEINNVRTPDSVKVFVNKAYKLPAGYEPKDLKTPEVRFAFEEDLPKKKMREEAAIALEKMFAAAEKEGILLYGVSGYRSYERQQEIYQERVNAVGRWVASRYVAVPGGSEHQTGLAMDIGNHRKKEFGSSKEGKWVHHNCQRFGFIIRYPLGKEHITGIAYEPWHVRYVGEKAANDIMTQGITLEEYLEIPAPKSTHRFAASLLNFNFEGNLKHLRMLWKEYVTSILSFVR